MAEIVNLRLARKARARNTAGADAAANRAKFGRNKADKAAAEAETARIGRIVDGARLDTPGEES